MTHFKDNGDSSVPIDSGGRNAPDNRPQSRIGSRHCSSIQSNFDFMKPRFSERNSNPRAPSSINRSKHFVPVETDLCLQFRRGKCYHGEKCQFSHDARKPRLSTGGRMMPGCHWFARGLDCPYGDRCQFFHDCDGRVRREGVSAGNGGRVGSGSDWIECRRSMNRGDDYYRLVPRRMRLCMNWERSGSCPYGVKCIYAHGRAELQELGSPAEMEYGNTPRLKLSSSRGTASSPEIGNKTAKKLQLTGRRYFMKWDMKKISQIYADEIDDRHNVHVSLSKVRR